MNLLTEHESILFVDDDNDILASYQALFKQQEEGIRICNDPMQASAMIPPDWRGVVVLDIYMPYLSGIELMEQIHKKDKAIPVLLVTGHGDVPMAVEAVKKGAYDFLEKPVDPELLITKIKRALAERTHYLTQKTQKKQQLTKHLIGESTWAKEARETLLAYSLTTLPIYIYGPAGTGKLLAAQQLIPDDPLHPVIIHNLKQTDSLAIFEQWQTNPPTGTLILQHIDRLPAQYQTWLVHQQTQPERHFRLIVTSYERPEFLAKNNILLPEFYYLFSLTQLACVSLQDRKKDIMVIFEHYLKIACKRLSIKRPILTESLKKTLNNRPWHNNVSELINAAELLAVGIMPTKEESSLYSSSPHSSLEQNVSDFERHLITSALDMHHGNINETADYLQIPRKKLYLRMKKYQLDKERFKY